MNTFKLSIVTPDGEIFSDDAISINVKTDEGNVQIMRGHTDYLATLGTGKVKFTDKEGNVKVAAASGGFISVSGGDVRMVATTFEFADSIDVERAEKAKKKAEEALANATSDNQIRIAKAKLARALSRLSVASEI